MGGASTSQQGPWGPQREPGWAPPAPCALSPLPQPDMGEAAHGQPAGPISVGKARTRTRPTSHGLTRSLRDTRPYTSVQQRQTQMPSLQHLPLTPGNEQTGE